MVVDDIPYREYTEGDDSERARGVEVTYKVVYYLTERGDNPVEDFVHRLDPVTRARFFSYVEMLEVEGPNLKRPYADTVKGKIRELRPRQARVLYFFVSREKVILLHGFLKKAWEIDPKDIALAETRMADYLRRRGGHG
jgi:hypothetical protein